jgi:Flp pilus assembly protein TadG
MRCGFNSDAKRGLRAEHGAIAVEFALIFPILMLLVFGIIDFGHYWYIGHVMSDASREGARYGTRYTGKLPGALSPTISNHVLVTNGYAGLLPSEPSPTVTPTGAAMTANIANLAGKDLVVTVTATKTWWVLGSLIPGFGSSKLLTVATTMTCE